MSSVKGSNAKFSSYDTLINSKSLMDGCNQFEISSLTGQTVQVSLKSLETDSIRIRIKFNSLGDTSHWSAHSFSQHHICKTDRTYNRQYTKTVHKTTPMKNTQYQTAITKPHSGLFSEAYYLGQL